MTTPLPRINRAPKQMQLSLAKGQDLVLTFRYKVRVPDSDPPEYVATNIPSGCEIVVVIDTAGGPLESDPAEVAGSLATVRMESTVTDDIPRGLLWRLELRFPDTPILNRVPANGIVERHDGKRAP